MDDTTLATLISIATRARDAAAAEHGQAQQRARRAQAAQRQLQGYAEEYERRARTQRSQGLDAAADGNQRAFDARMQQALQAQARDVAAAAAAVDRTAAQLAQREQRLRTLEKLAERRRAEALQLEARREQKLNDEFAGRAAIAAALAAAATTGESQR